jgi:hypothetical protein
VFLHPVRDDWWVESLLEKARCVPKERLVHPSKISNPRFVPIGTINTQIISEKHPKLTLLYHLHLQYAIAIASSLPLFDAIIFLISGIFQNNVVELMDQDGVIRLQ